MDDAEYDLIVIGAGPVGENVADRAAAGGLRVAIVERELVGGECSYWACIPSKVLLRPGAALRAARAVPGAAEGAARSVDLAAVLRRRDEMVSRWDDSGQVEWLEGAGIDLVRGHGRLSGERAVDVTAADGAVRHLRAAHAVAICTGSRAVVPDIPGLRDARPWTSREATSADAVPASLAVIGGGVVGTEMATAFTDLGSRVTLVARAGLLAGTEEFAGSLVAEALRERGATLHLHAGVERVERDSDGSVHLHLTDGTRVDADEVLVAAGRSPRTDDVGVDIAGLNPGDAIAVDDTLRVPGSDWLYAVGDVTDRAALTHQGKYQARAAGDVIAARATGAAVDDAPWGAHVATADHAAVPQVVFTDPEVASVGRTAAAAEHAGLRVRTVEYDLGAVSGAGIHAEGYRGRAALVVDEDRGVVVGATFVGPDVAELVHAATIAVVGEVPIARLWHAVPAFPTMSEVWLRLLETYGRPGTGAER